MGAPDKEERTGPQHTKRDEYTEANCPTDLVNIKTRIYQIKKKEKKTTNLGTRARGRKMGASGVCNQCQGRAYGVNRGAGVKP